MINGKTPISDLTVDQLSDLIRRVVREEHSAISQKERAYGIQGIAELFGVSYSQAKVIKNSGDIDAAITQRGRTIIVDSERALKLWNGRRKRNF